MSGLDHKVSPFESPNVLSRDSAENTPIMTRSSLDPSVLAPATANADPETPLEFLRQQLRGTARKVAERVFLREVALVVTDPANKLFTANSQTKMQATAQLTEALRKSLTQEELDGIAAHAEDIADTLSRAWVDLWARTLTDDSKKITGVAPTESHLSAAWSEVLAQLGLETAESTEIFQVFYRSVHEQGTVIALPNGLVLDGRTSDLWLRKQSAESSALVDEFAMSGQQLRESSQNASADPAAGAGGEQKRKR